MRQAAGIFRNAAIVGETRDRLYVRERRPSTRHAFGLLSTKTKRNFGTGRVFWLAEHTQKRGGRFPASPLEPLRAPPVQQDPADSFFPPSTPPAPLSSA